MMGMLSCREAGYYLSLERDQTLAWPLKTKLSLHLAVCKNCRRYRVQLQWIDHAVGTMAESSRSLTLPEEARSRIAARLRTLDQGNPEDDSTSYP